MSFADFILILYVAVGGFNDYGAAITSVGPFHDERSCVAAGEQAKAAFKAKYVCVKKG